MIITPPGEPSDRLSNERWLSDVTDNGLTLGVNVVMGGNGMGADEVDLNVIANDREEVDGMGVDAGANVQMTGVVIRRCGRSCNRHTQIPQIT